MHHLTRRALASTACATVLLFGASACGDDDGDPAVDVNIDEEQLDEDLDDTGEDIQDTADEIEDTIDENVDIGDDAEDQGDG